MKANHVKSHTLKVKYYELYKEGIGRRDSPGIILRLAEHFDIAPCLIAKLILQRYFEECDPSSDESNTIQSINLYMRDTTLIPDMDLSYEIFLCTLYDDLYSPLVETIKQ